MRVLLLPVMLAALAACGEARTPYDAEAAEPQQVSGHFRAASENARAFAGDLSVERGGLIFSRGAVLYTRSLDPRRGGDRIAEGGATYAEIALGRSDLHVELRRVIDRTQANSFCAQGAPTFVALVHQGAGVAVLIFSGDEAPGPQALRSRLCTSLAYEAPHGARSSQGVVLW